ncbi:BnaCnng52930D [Brassica napus]|uniref:BnaCnng52930D protein n=1 Tax=Brassica napus TaxID=3708 RepID=A0A078JH77_BRANA|nr:BnaCnng52930D [Brassica napus]
MGQLKYSVHPKKEIHKILC